jgi:cytochrome P450
MERWSTFTVAELDTDPHGIFRKCRPFTPVLKRAEGGYIAIRARDVEQLVTDPRTRQMETESVQARGVREGALFNFFRLSMLFTNGPEHRRRRAPVARAFAWQLIAALRPRIRAAAHELIDAHASAREMNFLDDFCALIPARIISDMLGLPREDIPHFTRSVYAIARAINGSFTPADIPGIEAGARDLTEYVAGLLASRRANPRDDFLSAYIKSVEEAGEFTPLEAVIQIVTLVIGGSDTTRGALAVQAALLLQHREQWEAVCQDASLIPGAVSEALRYEPSVGSVPRVTVEDVELEGCVVPRGQMLSLSTMAAMRDPERFTDPDRFDIRRADRSARHHVFGGGTHRCLGELLARAELEEALAALAQRLPSLEIAGAPPVLTGHAGIRRISGMHVQWR